MTFIFHVTLNFKDSTSFLTSLVTFRDFLLSAESIVIVSIWLADSYIL
jgi:hypothetical protein